VFFPPSTNIQYKHSVCDSRPHLACAQVSPLNERLREVPGAKMVVDVVQVNNASGSAQLRKVVQFVCGNALVCETIKEARTVAFDGPVRLKVSPLGLSIQVSRVWRRRYSPRYEREINPIK